MPRKKTNPVESAFGFIGLTLMMMGAGIALWPLTSREFIGIAIAAVGLSLIFKATIVGPPQGSASED